MLQNWLSSCLRRTLFASGEKFDSQLDYVEVDSLSSDQDVFRAVFAAYGGSPPDDVVDALVDCRRRRSTSAHRRRRRSSRLAAPGPRCRRRAGLPPRTLPAASAADRRTTHGETVHDGRTHPHRRRSINDGDFSGKIVDVVTCLHRYTSYFVGLNAKFHYARQLANQLASWFASWSQTSCELVCDQVRTIST